MIFSCDAKFEAVYTTDSQNTKLNFFLAKEDGLTKHDAYFKGLNRYETKKIIDVRKHNKKYNILISYNRITFQKIITGWLYFANI